MPNYSGMWTLQAQMQAAGQTNWTGIVQYSLYAWGQNNVGQLGQNNTTSKSSPVQIGSTDNYSLLGGPSYGVMSIKTDGSLWGCGKGGFGQLGVSPATNFSSPVQVGGTTWSKIAKSGFGPDGYAIKSDGTLWSWGYNLNGELGQNNTVSTSSPVQIGALTTWLSVAAGGYFLAATKTDGTLWLIGKNNYGQLAQNNIVYRSSPVQVGAGTTWSNLACGNNHVLATKTDGSLWAWGFNNTGQLGQNNTSYKSSPTQVGADTTWSKVAAGNGFSFATKTNGTLWSWGSNGSGQLGQNTVYINLSSPVQVGALTTWNQVSCGNNHVLATKTDGTLWIWGYNAQGQLGQSDTASRSSPVQVGSLTSWSNIQASSNSTFANIQTST